jgi:hypothetical protein
MVVTDRSNDDDDGGGGSSSSSNNNTMVSSFAKGSQLNLHETEGDDENVPKAGAFQPKRSQRWRAERAT